MDLFEEIKALKKKQNAIILAHYYQEPDIQDVADFIGDSLALSKKAANVDADVILFAGVHFMADTAKILDPTKKVIVPDLDAGCSLADSCPADRFGEFVRSHPDHIVVSYINCTAEVKALSNIICTSSNAEKIIASIPDDEKIIFAPDKNLGAYLVKQTGRDMVLWDGTCVVHELFSEKKMLQLKVEHPNAKVIAHPECEDRVLQHADFIGSTSALLKFVEDDFSSTFIVATEVGIIHQMEKQTLNKKYIPAPPDNDCACNECPHMKKNTLEKVRDALRTLKPEVDVPCELRERALAPIQKMLEL